MSVSGSSRLRQPAERPPRQKTVKGMEVWRARWRLGREKSTHRHTHKDKNVELTCLYLVLFITPIIKKC